MVIAGMLLSTLPLSSNDRVDRLHCQLGEIITITTMQLAECARLRQTGDSTSGPDRSRADWQKGEAEPSMTQTTPSPAWASS
jgi:hypothetical protein